MWAKSPRDSHFVGGKPKYPAYNVGSPKHGGETVSTLSVEALEASRGLRGPVNKPEQPISAEDNFALAA